MLKSILAFLTSSAGTTIFKAVWKIMYTLITKRSKRNADLQDSINDINRKGSQTVNDARRNIDLNETILDEKLLQARKELAKLVEKSIEAPNMVLANQKFPITVRNVDAGLPILVDKQWKIATTPVSGQVMGILNSKGKRTIDIEIETDQWLSVDIEVV